MSELVQKVDFLAGLSKALMDSYTRWQDMAARAFAATQMEDSEAEELSSQVSVAHQHYRELFAQSRAGVSQAADLLRVAVQDAAAKGVLIPNSVSGYVSDDNVTKYAHVMQALDQVIEALSTLIQTITAFDAVHEQICNAFALLQDEQSHLAEFESAHTASDRVSKLREGLEQRFADPKASRQELQHDVEQLIEYCRAEIEQTIQHEIGVTHGAIKQNLERLISLISLSADREEDTIEFNLFEEQLPQPNEILLLEMRRFQQESQDRLEHTLAELRDRIETMAAEANELLNDIHAGMSEAIALHTLINELPHVREADLTAYLTHFEASLVQARHAGVSVLNQFEEHVRKNSDYTFANNSEIERIGAAIVSAAEQSEQYHGRLWKIGGDAIVLMVSQNLDAQGFYERYGYEAVARAFHASLEPGDFVQALSVLRSLFIPVGKSEAESIQQLIDEPRIRDCIVEAISLDVLVLDQSQLATLEQTHYEAMLVLLEHADSLQLPERVSFQWASLLHDALSTRRELHHRASKQLLLALLRHQRYVSAYYTLRALENEYPDLWDEPALQSMFHVLTRQAVELGTETRHFLVEICSIESRVRVSATSFDTQFMFAALAHHLTMHMEANLLTLAWEFWEKELLPICPTLADALLRQLNGDIFSVGVPINSDRLRQQLDDILAEIRTLFDPPSYKMIALAAAIHRWYVNEYMNSWFDQLQSDDFTIEDIDRIADKIADLRRKGNLVDACPLQDMPSRAGARPSPIEGQLKQIVQGQLLKILNKFQQAFKVARQLIDMPQAPILPHEQLTVELQRLRERSELVAWSAEHLLGPDLPFIYELHPSTLMVEA